jgi:hypothetical protein
MKSGGLTRITNDDNLKHRVVIGEGLVRDDLLVQALDLLQIVIFEVGAPLVGGPLARSKSTVNHYIMIIIINK